MSVAHFFKGRLVGRYSQEKMGEYLGTSQPAISRELKKLEQEGFIKKIVRPTKIGNINYYQLGIYEGVYGTDTYTETIWLDEHFTKIYGDKKKYDIENRRKEAAIAMIDSHDDWLDFRILLEDRPESDIDEFRALWDERKSA